MAKEWRTSIPELSPHFQFDGLLEKAERLITSQIIRGPNTLLAKTRLIRSPLVPPEYSGGFFFRMLDWVLRLPYRSSTYEINVLAPIDSVWVTANPGSDVGTVNMGFVSMHAYNEVKRDDNGSHTVRPIEYLLDISSGEGDWSTAMDPSPFLPGDPPDPVERVLRIRIDIGLLAQPMQCWFAIVSQMYQQFHTVPEVYRTGPRGAGVLDDFRNPASKEFSEHGVRLLNLWMTEPPWAGRRGGL